MHSSVNGLGKFIENSMEMQGITMIFILLKCYYNNTLQHMIMMYVIINYENIGLQNVLRFVKLDGLVWFLGG